MASESGLPTDVGTLVQLLRWRAEHQAEQAGYTFLADGEGQLKEHTWAQLDRRARAVGAWLQAHAEPGARVLLMFEEGLEYLDALFGCMYAGSLAVPVHPPDPRRLHRTLPRLLSICGDAGVTVVLTTRHIARGAQPVLADDPVLGTAQWLCLDELSNDGADQWIDPGLGPQDLAYLQYTSGSTSTPKGVMINHHNLIHQLTDFDTGYDHHTDSVMVTWLPATHDLGLVYGRFMPLFIGFRCVFMSAVSFMQRPVRWLAALHTWRGTHSPSPNFGFEVVVHRTSAEDLSGLDLSCVRVLLNGAEPIRQTSEELFIQTLTPYGLPPAAVTHAMGMSESTAKIMTEPIDRYPPKFAHLDAAAYEDNHILLVERGTPNSRSVASNGTTVLDTRVEIVDPASHEKLGEDRVGEMWVFGTTVAQGYYNNPEATQATFQARTTDGDGPFLRTGDLAFIHEGEIYLTGRLKDVVIIRGQNHHPQDIEWTMLESVDILRPNCAAAFGIQLDDQERLVVVAEVYPDRLKDSETCFAAMRQAISEEHGLTPASLVLLQPKALPKTSSGKIQRSLARARFLGDDYDVVARWDAPRGPSKTTANDDDLPSQLTGASPRRQRVILIGYIQALAAELMGLDPEDIESDRPLGEIGLDSVTAVEMVERVGGALGREVSGTVLFDHPSVEALATFLLEDDSTRVDASTQIRPSSTPGPSSDDVASMSEEEAAAALLAELEDL